MNPHASAQPCGCDPGLPWVCEWHQLERAGIFNNPSETGRPIILGPAYSPRGLSTDFPEAIFTPTPTHTHVCRTCGEFLWTEFNRWCWLLCPIRALRHMLTCPKNPFRVRTLADEAVRSALQVVMDSAGRCDICGLTVEECIHSGLPHMPEEVDAAALLFEELRGVGLEIRRRPWWKNVFRRSSKERS